MPLLDRSRRAATLISAFQESENSLPSRHALVRCFGPSFHGLYLRGVYLQPWSSPTENETYERGTFTLSFKHRPVRLSSSSWKEQFRCAAQHFCVKMITWNTYPRSIAKSHDVLRT